MTSSTKVPPPVLFSGAGLQPIPVVGAALGPVEVGGVQPPTVTAAGLADVGAGLALMVSGTAPRAVATSLIERPPELIDYPRVRLVGRLVGGLVSAVLAVPMLLAPAVGVVGVIGVWYMFSPFDPIVTRLGVSASVGVLGWALGKGVAILGDALAKFGDQLIDRKKLQPLLASRTFRLYRNALDHFSHGRTRRAAACFEAIQKRCLDDKLTEQAETAGILSAELYLRAKKGKKAVSVLRDLNEGLLHLDASSWKRARFLSGVADVLSRKRPVLPLAPYWRELGESTDVFLARLATQLDLVNDRTTTPVLLSNCHWIIDHLENPV